MAEGADQPEDTGSKDVFNIFNETVQKSYKCMQVAICRAFKPTTWLGSAKDVLELRYSNGMKCLQIYREFDVHLRLFWV